MPFKVIPGCFNKLLMLMPFKVIPGCLHLMMAVVTVQNVGRNMLCKTVLFVFSPESFTRS